MIQRNYKKYLAIDEYKIMLESKRKKDKYKLLRNYYTTINKTFISVKMYYLNDAAEDE